MFHTQYAKPSKLAPCCSQKIKRTSLVWKMLAGSPFEGIYRAFFICGNASIWPFLTIRKILSYQHSAGNIEVCRSIMIYIYIDIDIDRCTQQIDSQRQTDGDKQIQIDVDRYRYTHAHTQIYIYIYVDKHVFSIILFHSLPTGPGRPSTLRAPGDGCFPPGRSSK